MVFKNKEKIQASANLQITVEKNLQNTHEIEFMDYRGGVSPKVFCLKISTILAHSTILRTTFVLDAYIAGSSENSTILGTFDNIWEQELF